MLSFSRSTLAAAALLSFSGSAIAADPVIEDVTILPTVYDWSGVYVGLQGGYGWADADETIFTNPPTVTSFDLDGFFLGGLAGYNFQSGNIVYGIEGDVNASWIDLDDDVGDADIDWFGSLRGRLGYAWDRTQLFGTVGVAFASLDWIDAIGPADDNDLTLTGWTAGLGLEHAFNENWLGRVEYRYYDFGDDDILRGNVDLSMQTVSVGIAYKF